MLAVDDAQADTQADAPPTAARAGARLAALADDHEAKPVRRVDGRQLAGRALAATWPKVAAVAIFLFVWQCVVWSGWKPEYVLPGPGPTWQALRELSADGTIVEAVSRTMRRAAIGFALSVVIGVAIGAAVSSSTVVRSAIGSMITGIQTMPSIAWFPLAIAMFQLSEGAIRFVVVLGAAPAIANGLISGVDHVPPLLKRAGHMLGARHLKAYRHVILPATLPSFVGGLKQGWAFAWRSLMAGELLVIIARKPSVGSLLSQTRELSQYDRMVAMMVVIFSIGLAVDAVLFGTLDRAVRRRWGLLAD